MVIEKCVGKANAIECLLEIHKIPIVPNRYIEGIPKEWNDKINGKRIVALYVGADTIYCLRNHLQYIYSSICYALRLFENSSKTSLVWLDDGLVKDAVQSAKDASYYDDALKNEEILLKEIEESHSVIHASGDNLLKFLEIADVYYGDSSKFLEIAKSKQMRIVKYDSNIPSQIEHVSLEKWLENVICSLDFEVKPKSRISERRTILFYMQPYALLEQKQLSLDKLERVASMACARKSLQFYWAEHPQTERLLQILPPKDRERYFRIRQVFMNSGTIIEFGSQAYKKVLGEVDVYYGDDYMSLCGYQRQGVPVIEQSCAPHIRQHIAHSLQGDSMGVQMGQGCWLEDYYYFSLNVGNGLCRMAREKDIVEYITPIPYRSRTNRRTDLFSAVIPYAHKLYLVPNGAQDFAIYDRDTHTWRSLVLDNKFVVDTENDYMFSSAVLVGDTLWCIPNSYGAIVKLDLLTEEISYFYDWHDELQKYITLPKSTHWSGGAVLVNGKLYFTASQSTHVICFDIEKGTSKVYHLNVNAQGLGFISYDGRDFWIVTIREGKGKLVRWHPERGVILVLADVFGENSNGGMAIAHSNSVWIFEARNDTYARYDLDTGDLTLKKHFLPEDIRDGLGGANLSADESYVYILPDWGELLVRFNPKTEEVSAFSPRLDKLGQKSYVRECFSSNIISEHEFFDDNELAIYMENVELRRERLSSVGEHIYQKIIGA